MDAVSAPAPPASNDTRQPGVSKRRREGHFRKRRLTCAAAAGGILAQCWLTAGAWAIDIEPRDYVPAPSGTNILALYSLYDDYGPLNIARGPTIGGATDVQSVLEILRYIHYGDIQGRSYALQLVVPTGTLHGEIAGQKLPSDGGIGDLLLAAGVSLLPHPQPNVNLAIVSYTSVPTGSYAPERLLNLGANSWSEDVQFGYTQGIGAKGWFDFAADMVVYGANAQAGPNRQTLLQEPTYQLQAWLSYAVYRTSLISAGYSALLGGTQSVGGVQNGVKTQSQQIRAAYTQVLSPSFQILASVTHDINVVGGFKQTFGLLVRAAYFF
jgi:hypothetical protein